MELENVIWVKLKDASEGIYKDKTFKVTEQHVTGEDDKFNAGKKKLILHLKEFETGVLYNVNMNNTSIQNLLKEYGNNTMNWTNKSVTISSGKVSGKDAILVLPKKQQFCAGRVSIWSKKGVKMKSIKCDLCGREDDVSETCTSCKIEAIMDALMDSLQNPYGPRGPDLTLSELLEVTCDVEKFKKDLGKIL